MKKRKKVIELHKNGKTIREMAPIVNITFRNISNKIKQYEKNLENTKKEDNETKRIYTIFNSNLYN